jgi:endonuclease YncB( thermonuclease family)
LYWARITEVYDGDTWHAVIKVNGQVATFTLRLAGIDTPETRGQTLREKEAAKRVRDYCRTKWLNRRVRILAQGLDKYGRLLATVYPVKCGCFTCGTTANHDLLNRAYALPYAGGTKDGWTPEALDRILGQDALLPF